MCLIFHFIYWWRFFFVLYFTACCFVLPEKMSKKHSTLHTADILTMTFQPKLFTFSPGEKECSVHILPQECESAIYRQYFICRTPGVPLEWNIRIAKGRVTGLVPVSNDRVWPSENNELFMVKFNKLKHSWLWPSPENAYCSERWRGKNSTRWPGVIEKACEHIKCTMLLTLFKYMGISIEWCDSTSPLISHNPDLQALLFFFFFFLIKKMNFPWRGQWAPLGWDVGSGSKSGALSSPISFQGSRGA